MTMTLAPTCERSRTRWALLLPGLLAAAVAAVPVRAETVSETALETASGRVWVLLPMNVEDVPPEYLADGTQILDTVMAEQLRRAGIPFVQLSLVDGIRRWARATDDIGGLVVDLDGVVDGSVEEARRHLVRALVREFDAAGVLWPDVRERRTQKAGAKLTWDGVSRRIPGRREVTRARPSPNLGSSIRVRVFDADARLVHDRHAGLEVIHTFVIVETEGLGFSRRFWYEFRVRTDLFEDRSLLADAVRSALPAELR